MSETLDYTRWPIAFWKLTTLNGCKASDDEMVSFTLNEVNPKEIKVSIPRIGYSECFTGEGGKACNAESEITSSKVDDNWELTCTKKPAEPATWTAREQ